MASLWRGLFAPGIRPVMMVQPRPALAELSSRTRLFTTTVRNCAAKPKPIVRQPVPTTKQPPAPTGYAIVRNLAAKPTPTILYEAPSHFWFYFGCWSSGGTILTWTLLTGPTVIDQPEGVPVWVPWVYSATYVLFAAMGFYLISKTPNIVRTIRVIPTPRTAPGAGGGVAAPSLRMEVTVNRALPFLEPKVLTTDLDKVSLASRLSLPEEYVPRLRREELRREEERKAKQLRKFDMEHLLTMPFRQLGRAFVGLFRGVRAAWTDMGFGVIRVDGKPYKVDVTQGFAHDGFRTLERIVPIKEK